jgi:hypothetical protein
MSPYLQPMTLKRACAMRDRVAAEFHVDWLLYGVPSEVLVIAGPMWMAALGGLLHLPQRPRIHWLTETDDDWEQACRVLDAWGWSAAPGGRAGCAHRGRSTSDGDHH